MKNIAYLLIPASLLMGADFWNTKAPELWSPKETERLMSRSPWAKEVTAVLDLSRMGAGMPGGGPGMAGGMPPGGGMPELKAVVRWESAAPIRTAARRQFPGDVYVISVSGLPMMGQRQPGSDRQQMNEHLKAGTRLSVKGKPDLHPMRVMPEETAGTLLFYFAKDADMVDTAKEVAFVTQMGPIELRAKFALKEMRFKGKLLL